MTQPTRHICTDPSRSVQVIKRPDMQGNRAGGFVGMEGGRQETFVFKQAVGRAVVEELAAIFGGEVSWGLRQDQMQRASG